MWIHHSISLQSPIWTQSYNFEGQARILVGGGCLVLVLEGVRLRVVIDCLMRKGANSGDEEGGEAEIEGGGGEGHFW